MQCNPKKPATKLLRTWLRATLPPLLATALVACGGLTVEEITSSQEAPERFDYSLSVDVAVDAKRADVEALYGGEVVVWRPEAGFAVLGLNDTGELSTLSKKRRNKNVVKSPEVMASGAQSGGRSAWSGGRSAWSGGRSAWSGGEPTTFTENLKFWDQINLADAQRTARNLGRGVKVAVIDTGIDLNHPGFEGKLAPTHEWKDFVDGDRYPQEVEGSNYGHGTGVASVVIQVAPRATILPLRALRPDGSGDVTDVTAAVDWAIAQGADIINLSLGTVDYDRSIQRMVEYAARKKVYVVASAGNSGDRRVTYPAANGDDGSGDTKNFVLGVGSVNQRDKKSSFSTYGDQLELLAPGENMLTLAPERKVAFWNGTSFAAPVVSGALALAYGERLDSRDEYEKLADHINSSAKDISDQNPDITLGFGRLDLRSFLRDELDL